MTTLELQLGNGWVYEIYYLPGICWRPIVHRGDLSLRAWLIYRHHGSYYTLMSNRGRDN